MVEKSKTAGPKRPKIILDTNLASAGSSGSCPFHGAFYVLLAVLSGLYCIHLYDREAMVQYSERFTYLGYVTSLFDAIDTYSPFHQFLESDEELIARMKAMSGNEPETKGPSKGKLKVLSKEELSKYNGQPGSPGLYLALLGEVFDVSKGTEYYGPGGGYAFFAGRDASRAYVTGDFEEAGLVDDVSNLGLSDYIGLAEWADFYKKDYKKVGVLAGRYYTESGDYTDEWKNFQLKLKEARDQKAQQDEEKIMFPPCNVEWSKEKGSRFWCTNKSGGIARNWVGLPRQLFFPNEEPRCACTRDRGSPSLDPAAKTDRGDLDDPHVREYPGCGPTSVECWHKSDKDR